MATAAQARAFRRCACGKTLPGVWKYGKRPPVRDKCYDCMGQEFMKSLCPCGAKLSSQRRRSKSKLCYSCKPKGNHLDRVPDIVVECGNCEKKYKLRPHQLRWRLAKTKHGKLFCSRNCASSGHHRRGNVHLFKRRDWWDDVRWYWERELVKLGLGMERGIAAFIEYTLDHPKPK